MTAVGESKRVLDPVDRISEILFGLIMAVTVVGSLSIATAGHEELRTVMIAAIGCNLAWGLVDAVMYLVTTLTERKRNRVLARRVAGAPEAEARRILAESLPEHVAAIVGPDEIEGMRRRLLTLPDGTASLVRDDWLAAAGLFLLVVAATFPVVLPFLLFHELATAMAVARYVTLAMLFLAGFALGRYAGHVRPAVTGALMALLGASLILVVMALGG